MLKKKSPTYETRRGGLRVATFITCISREVLEVHNGLPSQSDEDKADIDKVLAWSCGKITASGKQAAGFLLQNSSPPRVSIHEVPVVVLVFLIYHSFLSIFLPALASVKSHPDGPSKLK